MRRTKDFFFVFTTSKNQLIAIKKLDESVIGVFQLFVEKTRTHFFSLA